MVIADFETTNGHFAIEASRLLKNEGKLYAVGSQKELLKKVANEAKHQHLDTFEILSGHIEKLEGVPLKSGLLDLVIISNVFFTVENKTECVKEAHRLLRKGGRVLFVEWSDSFGGIGPHKSHVVKKENAYKIFNDNGFEFMKEVDADHYHYGIIFQKKV